MIKESEIKSYFDDSVQYHISLLDRQDAIGYNYREKITWFADHLIKIRGSMLNVGCNVGNLEYFIRKSGVSPENLNLFGIDISEKSISVAQRRNIAGSNFKVGSATGLDYPDETFDTVTLMEVIEHIPDQDRALREISRVLKRGGLLLLSTPNAECKPWLFDEKLRYALRKLLGRALTDKDKLFTLYELESLLLQNGLIPQPGTGYYWYRPYHILKGILVWPPAYALKGLLKTMQQCQQVDRTHLTDNQTRYYSQSIVAAARK